MKTFTTFLFVVLAVVGSVYSHEPQPRIINGVAAVSGQFPSTVFIETPRQIANCAGIVLNANHILTSSQCVLNGLNVTNPFFIRIIAGDLNLFTPTYRRFSAVATHIYSHPQYNTVTLLNDLAVVRIAPSIPFPHNTIDTAALNRRVRPIGTACQFAGWGVSNLQNARNAVQQVIPMPLLNRDQCNAATVHANRVLESMVCAGSLTAGSPAICDGNLGGGLYCNDELVGILAFGTGCGVANMPSVFTQVRFHEAWIQQQILRTDSTFP